MIISKAPVRLSMGGGGTDLPSYYEQFGGFLMAATINKYVYIMANRRFGDSIRISYSSTEIVDDVAAIKHNIFREAIKFTGASKGIELVSIADIPAHCGLGTSSTFTVSLLNALFSYQKKYTSIEELARAACMLELEILKTPIGKQDQYAAAYGGFNAYRFNRDGTVNVEPVAMREETLLELQGNLFLFYLGTERAAADILNDQDTKSRKKDQATLERLHRIKEMGLATKKVFESGNIDEFGEILHQHWLTKKGLSDKISSASIDEAYEAALKAGAIGGKVVGAGGGGFLMLYCPRTKPRFIAAMEKIGLAPTWFTFEREGAQIVFMH